MPTQIPDSVVSGFAHQDALRQKQQQAALKQQLEFERCSSVTSSLDPMGMDRERQLRERKAQEQEEEDW